ncbi:hypothetical protein FRC01_004563 [Tulasnella sp. 417]|nr:hypothetical protein FRC01_004563 [Tulasnella sp. 417]
MPPPAPAPLPVPLDRKVRRGNGGTDPTGATAFPNSPPSSTGRHGGHIPKIAGSEGEVPFDNILQLCLDKNLNGWLYVFAGGFLGLVIGLGLLFIGCSVAVWLLLKKRNERKGRPFPSLFSKLGVGKGSKSGGDGVGRMRGDRKGFVRTGDGNDSDEDPGRGTSSGVKLAGARARSPIPPASPSGGVYANDSNPFAGASTPRFPDTPGPYGEAFSARPSTDSLDEAVRGGSAPRPPHFVSPPTSPSFKDGSKFREGF